MLDNLSKIFTKFLSYDRIFFDYTNIDEDEYNDFIMSKHNKNLCG